MRSPPDASLPEASPRAGDRESSKPPSTLKVSQVRNPEVPVGTVWAPTGGAACRDCYRPILFRRTLAGRWQPIDDDAAQDVHYHRKQRAQVCPNCGSALFTTLYTDVPAPHYARGVCSECRRSWWIGKTEAAVDRAEAAIDRAEAQAAYADAAGAPEVADVFRRVRDELIDEVSS